MQTTKYVGDQRLHCSSCWNNSSIRNFLDFNPYLHNFNFASCGSNWLCGISPKYQDNEKEKESCLQSPGEVVRIRSEIASFGVCRFPS